MNDLTGKLGTTQPSAPISQPTPEPVYDSGLRSPFSDQMGDMPTFTNTAGALEPFSYGGDALQPFSSNTDEIERHLFDLGSRTLDPKFAEQQDTLRTQLSNQGIKLGSTAYDRATTNLGDVQSDAYNRLMLQGRAQAFGERMGSYDQYMAGRGQDFGQAMAAYGTNLAGRGQEFGENLSAYGANMGARGQEFGELQSIENMMMQRQQQEFSENLASRNQPINEIMALLSGSQVAMPSFGSTGGTPIPTTDYAGLMNTAYGQEWNAYQSQLAQSQDLMGGLFGMLGAFAGI